MTHKLTGKRLFAFGCSMTGYNYPTWADILGYHYPFYENWAKPGSGNNFILASIIECDERHTFTPDDDIIIMWTSSDRIDFYQFGWTSKNHAFPHTDPDSSCPDGYELLSAVYKISAQTYLEHKDLNFKSITWVHPMNSNSSELFDKRLSDIEYVTLQTNKNLANKYRTDFDEYYKFLNGAYKNSKGPDWELIDRTLGYIKKNSTTDINIVNKNFADIVIDGHPSPVQHLNFVKDYFSDFTISEDCVKWVSEVQNQIESGTYRGFQSFKPKERF